MTQAAFDRGNWQHVLDSHHLESHDAAEWLRYGSALLHSIDPGPVAGSGRCSSLGPKGHLPAERAGARAARIALNQPAPQPVCSANQVVVIGQR